MVREVTEYVEGLVCRMVPTMTPVMPTMMTMVPTVLPVMPTMMTTVMTVVSAVMTVVSAVMTMMATVMAGVGGTLEHKGCGGCESEYREKFLIHQMLHCRWLWGPIFFLPLYMGRHFAQVGSNEFQ